MTAPQTVSAEVERDGERVFLCFRAAGPRRRGVTVKLSAKAAAALCAVLGQAAGRRPARTYGMTLEGDLETTDEPATPARAAR